MPDIHSLPDIGRAFEKMKLVKKLKEEIQPIHDIATHGIKYKINNAANHDQIIKQMKDSINDGYKKLSQELSQDILKF